MNKPIASRACGRSDPPVGKRLPSAAPRKSVGIRIDPGFICIENQEMQNMLSVRTSLIVLPVLMLLAMSAQALTPSVEDDSAAAASSSGMTMSVILSQCKRPERCVIGQAVTMIE